MTSRRAFRRPVTILFLVAIAAAAVACGPRGLATPASTAVAAPNNPVVGLVTKVASAGLSRVEYFILRDSQGGIWEFKLGQLENPTAFPPGHLAEHQITADPVRVFFRVQDNQLVAYRLEDAAATSPPS